MWEIHLRPSRLLTGDRTFGRLAGLGGLICALATTIAGAMIWVLLTDPASMTNAIDTGDVGPLVLPLAQVVYDAMAGLPEYL